MAAQAKTGSCERRLVLSSKLSELDRLGAFARDIGRADGLDEDRVFALQLCLEEAVANIITHGGARQGSDKQICITIPRPRLAWQPASRTTALRSIRPKYRRRNSQLRSRPRRSAAWAFT